MEKNFNTSHVSINHSASKSNEAIASNFNTSHVSINLRKTQEKPNRLCYFNTSHVSINQRYGRKCYCGKSISIHLMFLLIKTNRRAFLYKTRISIHLMFLLIIGRR